MVGKRKRRADYAESNVEIGSHDKNGSERLQTLLRKHFEATYEPLDTAPSTPHQDNEKSSSGTDADEGDAGWSGISEDETANTVEVVDYTAASVTDDLASKEERKLFLSSKPPSLLLDTKPRKPKAPEATEDPSTEAALRKNDLALRRLLQESHLLSSSPSDDLSVTGKARHKALDLRLLALGSKKSLLEQKNMPMSHRRGIVGKKRIKEDARRAEAQENGIILEKEKKEVKKAVRRERGIGAPSVGNFRGGTLQLSRNDLREIRGPQAGRGRGGKRVKRR